MGLYVHPGRNIQFSLSGPAAFSWEWGGAGQIFPGLLNSALTGCGTSRWFLIQITFDDHLEFSLDLLEFLYLMEVYKSASSKAFKSTLFTNKIMGSQWSAKQSHITKSLKRSARVNFTQTIFPRRWYSINFKFKIPHYAFVLQSWKNPAQIYMFLKQRSLSVYCLFST